MNQDAPSPSFELPAPMTEAAEGGSAPFEAAPPSPERAPAPAPPAAQSPVPAAPVQPLAQPLPHQSVPAQSNANPSSPAAADDNDLIEKEWVVKAKQIVAATKDDPYAQNRELSKFKADYLKKRYNKDLKLEESQGGL